MAKNSLKLKIEKYNPAKIEAKWQGVWEEKKIYSPNLDTAKRPFYNLMMFPYPSAEGMHVGNMYAFTGADIYGRFKRMQGNDVFEPIGLDGFGIHSENYAIKVGRHPKEQAKISEKNFYRQLRATGNGYDWSRTVETYDPKYYKWTQWLFIQLFKAGLAYRSKAPVNFCPSCKTVLADEQVIDDKCERCSSIVEKKELEQWFFKITKYADRLLNGLSQIDWAERIKIAQRQWIGRSEGMIINFGGIDVFTTRPETADGATFLVLSPQHPKVKEFKSKEVIDYVKISTNKSDEERRKEKSGVFTGEYIINPLTKKKIPVWIADYVLMGYGTGAIMAVPAEDERDREFAEKYKIPIERTSLSAKPVGKKVVNYHLRDWLISRQRYWGPPIPMINCSKCGWQPVAEDQLPVLLPDLKDWKPLGTGKSPLANHPEFYETNCPKCKGPAKRETDVSDTFLDSAWYFLRYIGTELDKKPFEEPRVKKWLPVSMYIGGPEHAVLHLLYSRFIWMVLYDLGYFDFSSKGRPASGWDEPFTKFYAHGLIIKDGAKMSKSKGNVVVPDAYIKKYGADVLRCYLMFTGPFNMGGDFRDSGIEGMFRFLKRAWTLVLSVKGKDANPALDIFMHKTIKSVTEDMENLNYNTAIAHLMEYYNELYSFYTKHKMLNVIYCKTLVLLLAPLAPHMTEELFQRIKNQESRIKNKKET
ncbi:MAG: class I tRNA ligase family protein, partial [Patescibacteria group bacterium]